jgi:tRNA nucleotidyltransferase/poly(A) polymerase
MSIRVTRDQQQVLRILSELSGELQVRVCLVGGIVRDLLVGQSLHDRDIDFLIEGDARKFAKAVEKKIGGKLMLFDRFFTAKILNPPGLQGIDELDFASSRTECYEAPGKLPKVEISSLEDDLKRRDFSLNALALPIKALLSSCDEDGTVQGRYQGEVIDLFDGQQDLHDRKLRVLHTKSFLDDPTRIFRGFRYCARLQGEFEEETANLLRKSVKSGALSTISKQRIWNEISKIFQEERSAEILEGLCSEIGAKDVELFSKLSIPDLLAGLQHLDVEVSAGDAKNKERAAHYLVAKLLPVETGEDILVAQGFSRKVSRSLLSVARSVELDRKESGVAEKLFWIATDNDEARKQRLREQLAGELQGDE